MHHPERVPPPITPVSHSQNASLFFLFFLSFLSLFHFFSHSLVFVLREVPLRRHSVWPSFPQQASVTVIVRATFIWPRVLINSEKQKEDNIPQTPPPLLLSIWDVLNSQDVNLSQSVAVHIFDGARLRLETPCSSS